MRESLKHLFSNQVILEDKRQFFYTIKPYELINALGTVIASLQEYSFTQKEPAGEAFSCNLYKTKDGNWYDIEEATIAVEKKIIRMLKSAIDAKENTSVS
ncbi:MAG: hypothetical protein JWR61_667 [Ferruginibacter sp.]|jgi:hypothetical protein|uniref:hypothetical protein n=1 Tax=Ferruginibacter sp. TaxID=1940288 RepID=UPI00265A3BA2|nr:hypothetical protein [Ferruginibacter sp.]MDB5275712.1 hypothetical protein [Ferruginibacter sp.]